MKKTQKTSAPNPPLSREPNTLTLSQDQIAARAHDLWVARGRPAGADLDIWLEAERTLRQSPARRFKSGTTAADDDIEGAEAEDSELEDVVAPPPQRSTTAL